jgi:hypothetical protein
VTVDTSLDTIKRTDHPPRARADTHDSSTGGARRECHQRVNGSSGIRSARGVSPQMMGRLQYGHVPDSFSSQGRDLPAILTRTLAVPVKRLTPGLPATWARCCRQAAAAIARSCSLAARGTRLAQLIDPTQQPCSTRFLTAHLSV